MKGQGSFCNGKRLQVIDRTSLHKEDTVGLTSNSLKHYNTSGIAGRIRSLGSIAAEVVYTARGSLCGHVGWHEGANDLAAALCIAREAGCVTEYLSGGALDMREMVLEGRTREPFLVAPPNMAELLRGILVSRG